MTDLPRLPRSHWFPGGMNECVDGTWVRFFDHEDQLALAEQNGVEKFRAAAIEALQDLPMAGSGDLLTHNDVMMMLRNLLVGEPEGEPEPVLSRRPGLGDTHWAQMYGTATPEQVLGSDV